MRTTNIQNRIKLLEQRVLPQSQNSYVCIVDPGKDRDEVVERFRLDNNVQDGDRLHVVVFLSVNRP